MKKLRFDRIAMVVSTIVLICLTPALNSWANTMRPEAGLGGECLMWVMPVLIYGLYVSIKRGV